MLDSSKNNKVCLARQPILDLNESIVAYEMLFRQINTTDANVVDGTTATADVIMNLFNNIGLDNVIGNKKAFINFDEYFLKNDIINILPKDRVVLEILEHVVVDSHLFTQLKQLVASGYSLAIDDFTDNESTRQLFDLVEIMKIDISDYNKEQLTEYCRLGKQHNLRLLAERVETKEEFIMCKELGFELYQGYFFAKPEYIEHQAIPSSKISIMTILNDIMADKPMETIEKQIIQDVSVSYKLLRYINSAGLRRGTEVNSIPDVIRLLGIKPLYRWLSLFLFTNDNKDQANSVSSLFTTALIRAFFLEHIALHSNKKIANDLFILGIFSYLDTLLSMPFAKILEDIYIGDNIRNALLTQSGPYNDYYQLALLIDIPDDIKLASSLDNLNLSEEDITAATLFAMQSTNNLLA